MHQSALDQTLNQTGSVESAENEIIIPAESSTVESASEVEVTSIPEIQGVEVAAEAAAEVPAKGKEAIVDLLRELSAKDASEISNDEVSRLKQQFYACRNEELRVEREAWIAARNSAEGFEAAADEAEEEFKQLLAAVREKKAQLRAEIESRQQANYERKRAIVDSIAEMSADADNANKYFQQVRDLQTEFKSIGEVPAPQTAGIWKAYQDAVEKYYDQLKVNKELRDYDFKKNLAEKEALVAEAEKLLDEPDVVNAFKKLQALHEQWRGVGPVPKEVREEIWNRFKAASSEINRRYQAHFEERKQREQENEDAKTKLCERIEEVDYSGFTTYSAWEEATRVIIEAQTEWKGLGYASRKANNQLFARFRDTCDKFFTAKAEFFKSMKQSLSTNLEKKIALCERAEALKDSTEWRKTAEELAKLQKEWKSIGPVAKKHSDQVWQRFLAACDYFFEQKKKNTSGTRKTERANLEQKKEIIESLKAIDPAAMEREDAVKAVKELQARWQSVGHVPFSEKDAIYDAYRGVVDNLYKSLDLSQRGSRMASFESAVDEMGDDQSRLYRERERLARVYEQRRSELQTYENNMGFLSAKSKNGSTMLRDMERRIQRLRDDLADLEKKIRLIDAKL